MTDSAPWEDDDLLNQLIQKHHDDHGAPPYEEWTEAQKKRAQELIENPPVFDMGASMEEFEKLNPPNEERLTGLRDLMFGVKPDGQQPTPGTLGIAAGPP